MRQGALLNIYFLNHSSLTYQTWSINRYKQREYISEIFWTIWRTGAEFQTLFNLETSSNYSITSYVKFPVFHFSERVNKGELKWKISTTKNWQILLYWHLIKIIKESGTSFQFPTLSQKHVRNVCYKIP